MHIYIYIHIHTHICNVCILSNPTCFRTFWTIVSKTTYFPGSRCSLQLGGFKHACLNMPVTPVPWLPLSGSSRSGNRAQLSKCGHFFSTDGQQIPCIEHRKFGGYPSKQTVSTGDLQGVAFWICQVFNSNLQSNLPRICENQSQTGALFSGRPCVKPSSITGSMCPEIPWIDQSYCHLEIARLWTPGTDTTGGSTTSHRIHVWYIC